MYHPTSNGADDAAGENYPLKPNRGGDASAGGDFYGVAHDAATAKENEANLGVSVVGMGPHLGSIGGQGGKELRSKGIRGLLEKQRVKWCIAIMVALVLLGVVLVATLLAFGEGHDPRDDTPRLVKLWPRPNREDNILYFQHGPLEYDGKEWGPLRDSLDGLIAGYSVRDAEAAGNVTECFGAQPPEGFSCFFDVRRVSPQCSSSLSYGYELGQPCVFLQFANVTGWRPESYTTRDLEINDQLPSELRSRYRPNVAYLDCQGVTIIDRELIGPLEYSPENGFKTNYFPYEGQKDYMPPLVAVRFANPVVGVAISVVCKLWAKNIHHDDMSVPISGTVYFTLLID